MPCPSLHYSFKNSKIIFVQCEIIQCYIETGLPKRFIFVWMTKKSIGGRENKSLHLFYKGANISVYSLLAGGYFSCKHYNAWWTKL